jgi:protein-tyrosine phosphatase
MAFSFYSPQTKERLAQAKRRAAHIGLDFHSHLLPGVDDGIETIADARLAINELKGAGFIGAVLTPHIYHGIFDNQAASLQDSFATFTAALRDAGELFQLFLAAEYFADEHFLDLIKRDELLWLKVADERWVLVEFSYFQETPYASICLSSLAARGYRPIIAHVERYRFVAQAPAEWLARFERLGAILQGDIGSLAGQHGDSVRQFAKWLLGRGLVPVWGTDLHKVQQMQNYIRPGLKALKSTERINKLLAPIEDQALTCA